MSIDGIFLTPTASGPMQSVASAVLMANKGLQGDRYAEREGTYSVVTYEPGRQLTLVSADAVEAALESASLPQLSSVGNLRRNLVLGGISGDELARAIGHVVTIGSTDNSNDNDNDTRCRILIHRNCEPCLYNEKKNGIPKMMETLWNIAGVNAEILVGGTIHVGDRVTITEETRPTDDGGKPAWFYIPPSKRNLQMVQEGIASMRATKAKLMVTDPIGVQRAEASFASVGLSFFPPDKS